MKDFKIITSLIDILIGLSILVVTLKSMYFILFF
jgi:hypothetical protein